MYAISSVVFYPIYHNGLYAIYAGKGDLLKKF